MSEMTLEEALERVTDVLLWLADTGQCKINEDDGAALRLLLPTSPVRAQGVRILNEAEEPERMILAMRDALRKAKGE